MRLSQRQVVLALLMMMVLGVIITFIYQLFIPITPLTMIGTIIGMIVLVGLLLAYWWGWEPARYITVISITLLIGFSTDGVYLRDQFTITAFLVPVLALIVAGPTWILSCSLGLLGVLVVRSGGQGVYVDPMAIFIYLMIISGTILAWIVTNTARRDAEDNAAEAHQALGRIEVLSHEATERARELATQNDQQRQLLDLVSTLETPTVSLAEGVLLAPVIGHLDSRRANDLTRRLLAEVGAQHAKLVILDIAGVPMVDTAVSQSLLRAIQAVRLLGCEVMITGISASVATTMTQLGIDMTGVRTARTPQEVI
ncbi:MAG: STAS domain-containing protein, partial [Oscillochloris sp.]|nr:STAS domain-containing protein [Oscillochloris sp.]